MSVNASTITTVGRKTTAWRALISVPKVFTQLNFLEGKFNKARCAEI